MSFPCVKTMEENSQSNQTQKNDSRHTKRIFFVQQLYASSFEKGQVDFSGHDELKEEFEKIISNLNLLDETIKKHAPKYPLENIAKTDLAILRLAVYELTLVKSEPPKVIINEAVELAKELGSDRSYAFVNGALGAILEDIEKK